MPATTDTRAVPRLDYLDSARGIAAMMVFIGHYINWRYEDRLSVKLLSIPFNPHDAVSFFFVLSGFVLSYKYLVARQSLDLKKYYVSRVFRLYPGFIVAMLLCVWFWFRYEWGWQTFRDVFLLNKHDFWEELLLIRQRSKYYLPGWTLSVEMTVSLIMPFLILVAKANRRFLPWLMGVVLLMGSMMISGFHFHFLLGMVASAWFHEIRGDAFRNTLWYRYRAGWVLLALLLFSIRPIDKLSALGPSLMQVLNYLNINFYHFSALASLVFIVAMLRNAVLQRVLHLPVLLYLGRISYGIYLCHWIFVWATFSYWDRLQVFFGSEKTTFALMFAVCLAGTLISASLLYRWVEKPFIALGKRLASRLKPGWAIG